MTYVFRNWKVFASYTGSKPADWGNDMPQNWDHHNVTVINKINGKRTRFDFWASIAKPELRTKYDVFNAFYCFVSDAIAGNMDFADFCAEVGYDEDSRRAEKTWKACKRSAAKLNRIYDGDLYELLDSLEDYA